MLETYEAVLLMEKKKIELQNAEENLSQAEEIVALK